MYGGGRKLLPAIVMENGVGKKGSPGKVKRKGGRPERKWDLRFLVLTVTVDQAKNQ